MTCPLYGTTSDVVYVLDQKAVLLRRNGEFDEANVWANYAHALRHDYLSVVIFDRMLTGLSKDEEKILECYGGFKF